MADIKSQRELSIDELGPTIATESFNFKTTDELEPLDEIVGQPRAFRAADVGLGIRQLGYHMYVAGDSGTGRMAFVRRVLDQRAIHEERPCDWLYVQNFDHPEKPILISLPAGQGMRLHAAMANLISRLVDELPKAFQREDFGQEKDRLRQQYTQRGLAIQEQLTEEAKKRSFAVQQIASNQIMFTPLKDGHPISEADGEKLSDDEIKAIDQHQRELLDLAELLNARQLELERQLNLDVRQVERSFAEKLLSPLLDEISRDFGSAKVTAWLEQLKVHFIENLDHFRRRADRLQPGSGENSSQTSLRGSAQARFFEYQVNVLVNNSDVVHAPVIVETVPTYRNLFGTVDRIVDRFGHVVTDFTRIKAGSLHRANGGYLVFHLEDALAEPFVWRQLKRMLKAEQATFEVYDPFAMFSVSGIEPEPIPLNVKLVVIGHPLLYHLLYLYDDDFRDIFRVKADFDTEMPIPESVGHVYGQLVCRVTREQQLPPFDNQAVAELIRASSRIAGDQRKLTAQFRTMIDLMREAALWAGQEATSVVSKSHVQKALDEKVYRSDLIAVRIRELIADKTLLISLDEPIVGQVNGLAVADLGDYSFGWPARLTASTGIGTAGVINIERESRLSGRTFDKGMLILEGFLRHQYAQDHPIALSASLTMEQSYGGIDGDSASAAELLALLSSIADVPLRQDIAITGSLNQRGQIQAVGGINEKIEGFFEVCQQFGLTGSQGVCIPAANVKNLVLHHSVTAAVADGRFHIWPIEHIDEALALFSTLHAGRNDDVTSFHGRVDQRLRGMLQSLRSNRRTNRTRQSVAVVTPEVTPTDPRPPLPGQSSPESKP